MEGNLKRVMEKGGGGRRGEARPGTVEPDVV